MSIDKKFTKLRAEYQKSIEFKSDLYVPEYDARDRVPEIELWHLLMKMSQEEIANLSREDQIWRIEFLDERKDEYLFQRLTAMEDPTYENPPLIKDGFFHPDIAAQLSTQVPVPVRNCPICKEQIRVQLTESQWASSRGPFAHDEIVDEHMASHILEHHPDTETAQKTQNKKKDE